MLAEKPRIVCGSKLDSAIPGNSEKLRAYAARNGYDYYEISAVIGDGVRELVRALARIVREHRVILSREDGEGPGAEPRVALETRDPSLRSG
jgi:GTPase involved in cell partitioning and DNA repair